MSTKYIHVLGTEIEVISAKEDIHALKFFADNPRVASRLRREADFKNLNEHQKQGRIYEVLQKEPSFKNLLPRVKDHGGLMEPILVRHDTHEVIEGNSRLAVYRHLNEKHPSDDKWHEIPCDKVSYLNPEQQDAFLSQIHVRGKTAWSAYAKARMVYDRYKQGMDFDKMKKIFRATESELKKRINVITMMVENDDAELPRFSYYDVLERTKKIQQKLSEIPGLKEALLRKIKMPDVEFTSPDLRRKLPVVLEKKNAYKKFIKGNASLNECYQQAKDSNVRTVIKQALERLRERVTSAELKKLGRNEIRSLVPDVRNLSREAKKIHDQVLKIKDE